MPGSANRNPDGHLEFEYEGETEIFWESQRTAYNLNQRIFLDEEGNEYAEGVLKLVPDASSASQGNDASQPQLTASRFEMKLIREIAERILRYYRRMEPEEDVALTKYILDIEMTHCNGTPLDLEKLRDFRYADFWHDIGGIQQHLDRETGKLKAPFHPRCALDQ